MQYAPLLCLFFVRFSNMFSTIFVRFSAQFCRYVQETLLVHTEKIALARSRKNCSSNNTTKIQNGIPVCQVLEAKPSVKICLGYWSQHYTGKDTKRREM